MVTIIQFRKTCRMGWCLLIKDKVTKVLYCKKIGRGCLLMKNYSIRGTIIQKIEGGGVRSWKHIVPTGTQGTIIQKICWGWCLLSKSYSTRVLYEPGGGGGAHFAKKAYRCHMFQHIVPAPPLAMVISITTTPLS